MTENTKTVPARYRDNMFFACIAVIMGRRRIQKINVTLPTSELTGDYLASLVAGLTPEEREFFAASLDAQVITHGLTNASAIAEQREGERLHWISALYSITYSDDGEMVSVDVDVISCGCRG